MILGAIGIIGSIEANRLTSGDEFCTSCHTMADVAADSRFRQSSHQHNSVGILASCSDCHIPRTNWFVETYTHLKKGFRDVIAERTGNFSNPVVWNARRVELADYARDEMRQNDSVTCRSCHQVRAIRPASKSGQAVHAALGQGTTTCIDCHANLVHAPPTPGSATSNH